MPTPEQIRSGEGYLSFPLIGAHSSVRTHRRVEHITTGPTALAELVTGVALLLARHNEARVVTVGCVTRDEKTCTLRPLRLDLGDEPAWGSALESVRAALEAPDLEVPNRAGHIEPPPVLVAAADTIGTPQGRPLALRRHIAASRLTVLTELTGSVLTWDYDADAHAAQHISYLAGQVRRLVALGRANPGMPVARMELAEPDELQALLACMTACPSEGRASLHRLFDEQAALHPEHIALTTTAGDVTYGGLAAWSGTVAADLAHERVGPGDRVGIRLARSPQLIAAMLGVLRTGAAYVPIDPEQPVTRQRRIAELAGLTALLVEDGDSGPALGVAAVPVPAVAPSAAPRDMTPTVDANRGPDNPDAPAYVLFTSGSTGEPKGVEVRHSNVARLFDTTLPLFGFGDRDVWLNAHSFAFDASVWEFYGALLHGGRLVMPDSATLRDPDALAEVVVRERVTMLTLSPTAFESFRDSTIASEHDMTTLRHLVLCAEALSFASLRSWFEYIGDGPTRTCNMFGITETTVHSTYLPLSRADVRDSRRRIGRGLPDTTLYILDTQGRRAPFGVPGEICVGGPGVSGGYLHPPEGARDPFVPDPFSTEPGARIYHSGDKGRLLADGSIEYLGRFDHQVKIRGYRVELGEIEAAFLSLPEVRSARAWTVARPGLPQVIAVAVVPTPGTVCEPARLRHSAAGLLPGYMVPAAAVVVDTLPRTANGKLDTSQLPDPFTTQDCDAGPDNESAAGSNRPLEAVLATVGEVLGHTPDANDGFFELGGDSITAVRLVTRLRNVGYAATIADVYAHRTMHDIATALRPLDDEHPEGTAPFTLLTRTDTDRVPDGAEDALPATRLQQGMLLHSLLDGEHVYHDILSYTVDGSLNEAALHTALDTVVRRQPILRTAFNADGPGTVLQVVHPTASLACVVHDLRHLPRDHHQQWLKEWAAAEQRNPFDWTVPGLLRLFVHRTGDSEWLLSLSVHHCILDGWSAASFVTELLTVHGSVLAGHEIDDAAQPHLMARYVALELAAENDPVSRSFWREYLHDAEPCELPGDTADVTGGPSYVDTLSFDIPAAAASGLRDLARREGVPPKTAFLAAHVALLAFVCGSPEVVTGVVTSARVEEHGGDRALGLFLNTLPMRVRSGDQTWRELLREVFLGESRTYPHRRVPFERIQAYSGVSRLAPTAFNYTDFHVYDELAAADVRLSNPRYREATDFRLLLTVSEDPFCDRVTVTFSYRRGAVTARQITAWAELYIRLVCQAVDNPDRPAVRSLAEEAAAQGQTAALGTAKTAVSYRSLLTLVAERLRSNRSAVAQVHRGREMTCGQLAGRVQHLRDRLVEAGARHGDRIACFLERGHDPLIALLSVWAAGCVYVPIDPALPPARQQALTTAVGCTFAVRSSGIRAERIVWGGPQITLALTAAEPQADFTGWHAASPSDEAYILFTSGSTGTPKAVAMPHRSIANLVDWQLAQPEYSAARRIAQFAALSFDVSVQEMLTAVAGGGTLAVIPDAARRDPQALLEHLVRDWVEVLYLPPAMLRQLSMAHQAFGTTPTAMRTIVTAGEVLVVTDAVRSFCHTGHIGLVNQYGPTETHVTTSHRLGPDPAAWPDLPPIGTPVAGVTATVCDSLGRPIPPGAPGELHLGGVAPALGYVDATGVDPRTGAHFTTEDGATVYRTGDLVRLVDGELTYLGRLDDQLKIRGFRVEPQESAALLLDHPGVAACAVVGEPGPDGDTVLTAYVVAAAVAGQHRATDSELTAYLRERLPEYAVPVRFAFPSRLPLTRSGKLDRTALAADPALCITPPDEAPATVSSTESQVLDVWQAVLGYPVASPTVSFFDAGGTSLLLLPLYMRLRKTFNADFALNDLFRFPTVRLFAQHIADRGNKTTSASAARHPRPARTPARIRAAARRSRSARGQENTTDE
ncbi:amino acid adenylation domain-containing protein [Streptomyces sp. NPDC058682]|uniref:amino acid adenylation domain-containing protein n=1 Tax=Streptomyces sp. NPDC058682 TaxID=3346596 RepID=UPI003669F9F3